MRPSYLKPWVDLDQDQKAFKFSTVGLYGTRRDELAFYTIEALVGGQRFTFNQPDWSSITQTIWRLEHEKDIQLAASDLDLAENASIVYKVHRYVVRTR